MKSADELRTEARRLIKKIKKTSDPTARKQLAGLALELSQRAEAMARWGRDLDLLRTNIDQYRSQVTAGIADGRRRRVVAAMLADAEDMLAALTDQPD